MKNLSHIQQRKKDTTEKIGRQRAKKNLKLRNIGIS